MKFRLASLLFLLSSTVFVNAPALSMDNPLLEERPDYSSSGLVAYRSPFTEIKVDFEALVKNFNAVRAAGNKASNTELVAYLVKEENWTALGLHSQRQLVNGVVEKALELRLNTLMSEAGIVSKYRSARASGNKASEEDLVAYLFGANWKTITPDKQGGVVEEVTRRAHELDVEEPIAQSGILEKYRSAQTKGNKASTNDLIAYLFKERWATLKPDIKDEIILRVEETSFEMDKDAVFALIRSGKLGEAFTSLRKDNGKDVSDEMIVKQALESLAFEGWNRLPEDAYSFMLDAVAKKDPRAIFETFDEKSQIEVAKTYRTIKNSGNKASDEDIVSYVIGQMGYKSWAKVNPVDQSKITRKVLSFAKNLAIPEWLRDASEDIDNDQVATLFTERMAQNERDDIIRKVKTISEEEDAIRRIAAVAANMSLVFTPGMTGDDHTYIIQTALELSADEIGPRMTAIRDNAGKLFPDVRDFHRATLTATLLSKTTPEIQTIADNARRIYLQIEHPVLKNKEDMQNEAVREFVLP